MKIGLLPFAATLAACLIGAPAHAQIVLVDEDFESYANTAAMNGVWTINNANGTLVDETYENIIDDSFELSDIGARAFPQGGQGAEHLGLGFLEIDLASLNGGNPIAPTASQSIVLQGDIFDVGGFGNKRVSIGLRSDAPAANLIELGQWNADPIGYAHRAILFPSTVENPNPNWAFFELNPGLDREDDADDLVTIGDIGEAWATYRVTITPDTLTYEFDLFRDGLTNDGTENPAPGVDASITYDISTDSNGYNNLRFGGPSGVSSLGNGTYGGVIYDNITLTLVDSEAPLTGDYNDDGVVDAADYTVWRDTLGDSADPSGSGADGNDNGVIDNGDYTAWSDNYGDSSLSLATAVPEPSSALLASLLLGLGFRRSRND
ncbi:hypothetical protein MalM25_15370 [Planctomycetes bacterium MalM25]|nr:hypothetical protein MalM25_15370 [Planctomycetes bacterium MalM25]